jgi:hypothetical protein
MLPGDLRNYKIPKRRRGEEVVAVAERRKPQQQQQQPSPPSARSKATSSRYPMRLPAWQCLRGRRALTWQRQPPPRLNISIIQHDNRPQRNFEWSSTCDRQGPHQKCVGLSIFSTQFNNTYGTEPSREQVRPNFDAQRRPRATSSKATTLSQAVHKVEVYTSPVHLLIDIYARRQHLPGDALEERTLAYVARASRLRPLEALQEFFADGPRNHHNAAREARQRAANLTQTDADMLVETMEKCCEIFCSWLHNDLRSTWPIVFPYSRGRKPERQSEFEVLLRRALYRRQANRAIAGRSNSTTVVKSAHIVLIGGYMAEIIKVGVKDHRVP